MPFGQLVLGPPGSGKTTYCRGLAQFFRLIERPFCLVNLDPANEVSDLIDDFSVDSEAQSSSQAPRPLYAIDINELISLSDVQDSYSLGPNGGLMYCLEFLEANLDWLFEKFTHYPPSTYYLFDFPGQVELFTHHQPTKNLILKLLDQWKGKDNHAPEDADSDVNTNDREIVQDSKQSDSGDSSWRPASADFLREYSNRPFPRPPSGISATRPPFPFQLAAVHLIDSYHCTDTHKFISSLLLSLSTMCQLELPHLNLLTKIDLLQSTGVSLPFPLDYYTQGLDLDCMLDSLQSQDPFAQFDQKYMKLSEAIMGLIEDYSLVHFMPLNISDVKSLFSALTAIDKANGYYYSANCQEEERRFTKRISKMKMEYKMKMAEKERMEMAGREQEQEQGVGDSGSRMLSSKVMENIKADADEMSKRS